MPKKNRLTEADIDTFVAAIDRYQTLLNLRDWRIEPGKIGPSTVMADVEVSLEDKLATYRIGRDFGGAAINRASLESTALHEILHIFLAPLIAAARSRDPEAIATAEHSVIVVLERVIYELEQQC